MRQAIPITLVLATLLAPIAGAVAQDATRSPVQTRRTAPAEEGDRTPSALPGAENPRLRAPDAPPPLAPPGGPPPAPPAPFPPSTTPHWQQPPNHPPAVNQVPPAWQPPPGFAGSQPHVAPGPQQPGRYLLIDREVSVLDGEGNSSSLGPLTLLFDTATGEMSYLAREAGGLGWRAVPRSVSPLHHPPAPHQAGPWTGPTTPLAPPLPAPFLPPNGGGPFSTPPGPPGAPSPTLPPAPSGPPGQPVPSSDPFTSDAPAPTGNPLVDTAGFRDRVSEADRLRAERRVGEAAFLALATPGSVILDCRSREKFERLHVRGAVNLPFPDITAEELARLIPSPDTRVLLYCNNNFADAPAAFPAKVAAAALNHHTFATLVAYGYRNVFELGPLVDVRSTEIPLEGRDAP